MKKKLTASWGKPAGFDNDIWDLLPDDVIEDKGMDGRKKALLALLTHLQIGFSSSLDANGMFFRTKDKLDNDCFLLGLEMDPETRSKYFTNLAVKGYIKFKVGNKFSGGSKFRVLTLSDCVRDMIYDDFGKQVENNTQIVDSEPVTETMPLLNYNYINDDFGGQFQNNAQLTDVEPVAETMPLLNYNHKNKNNYNDNVNYNDNDNCNDDDRNDGVEVYYQVPQSEPIYVANSVQNDTASSRPFDCFSLMRRSRDLSELNGATEQAISQRPTSDGFVDAEIVSVYREVVKGLALISNGPNNTMLLRKFNEKASELRDELRNKYSKDTFSDEVRRRTFGRFARIYDWYLTGTELQFTDDYKNLNRFSFDKKSLSDHFNRFVSSLFPEDDTTDETPKQSPQRTDYSRDTLKQKRAALLNRV